MKLIMMAAALMLGGAAVAQTTDSTTTAPIGGQTVAPGNTAPETDARGIAVISRPGDGSRRLQPARPDRAGRNPDADRRAADPDRRRPAAALHPHRHRPLHPDLRARPGALRALSSAAPSHGAAEDPPLRLQGRGTRRSLVEGTLLSPQNPSTTLRAVPLPAKSRGGIRTSGRNHDHQLRRPGRHRHRRRRRPRPRLCARARPARRQGGGERSRRRPRRLGKLRRRARRWSRRSRRPAARRWRTAPASPSRSRSRRWSPAAKARWGSVHILINNAGILRDKSFAKMSVEDFRAVVDVHLIGSAICTKAVWETMREQAYGRILMTSSSTGLYGNFGQANYGAAKLGLAGFAKTLHLEGAKYNIRVNTIAPTAATRMTEDIFPPELLGPVQPGECRPGGALPGLGGRADQRDRRRRRRGRPGRLCHPHPRLCPARRPPHGRGGGGELGQDRRPRRSRSSPSPAPSRR